MMFFGGLLVAGLGIALAYALGLIGPRHSTTSGTGEETALEILEKRYARGEIDQAEYERKRRNLTS